MAAVTSGESASKWGVGRKRLDEMKAELLEYFWIAVLNLPGFEKFEALHSEHHSTATSSDQILASDFQTNEDVIGCIRDECQAVAIQTKNTDEHPEPKKLRIAISCE